MPAATAIRLCPDLKFVDRNGQRIKMCSRQVMAILESYGPVEQMSVDEAYVDVSDRPLPAALAPAIQHRVRRETGLPASVGLATSKLVAKVASDYDKPEGCTIVAPGEEAAFLAPLRVHALWGIGPRTAERLALLGIQTIGELATADPRAVQMEFGSHAESLQARARGIDKRPVVADPGPPKSISQERTFARDMNDAAFLQKQITLMGERVAASLEKRELVAYTVTVKFRWADFTTFTRQKTLPVAIEDAEAIVRVALSIWQEHWPPGQLVRLLGVGVSNLASTRGRQLPLFDPLWGYPGI
jgi:DNA polymerase-4